MSNDTHKATLETTTNTLYDKNKLPHSYESNASLNHMAFLKQLLVITFRKSLVYTKYPGYNDIYSL